MIFVLYPLRGMGLNLIQTLPEVLRDLLIPYFLVEPFTIRVLFWLARLDIVQVYPGALGPCLDSHAVVRRAVVSSKNGIPARARRWPASVHG